MKTKNNYLDRVSRWFFYVAFALIVYMPLHVFIAQFGSSITGGISVWKAAKDILIIVLVPLLLIVSYRRGLFKNKTFRWIIALGAIYTLLHLLYVLFDNNDDTYSAILGSVYNTRLLGYLVLGYVVGSANQGKKYLKYLITASVIIATIVAVFGILQYFLPSDFLTHFGYSLDRGVKPLFFIDDRPNLPRIMSTLKDPNSLGAYLILPILLTSMALFKKSVNKELFLQPFRRGVIGLMLIVQIVALFLTFSRGALLGLALSIITILCIVTGERVVGYFKKYWYILLIFLVIFITTAVVFKESSVVQDYIFHAAVSTDQQDPNEKRVSLVTQAVDDIVNEPEGHGPGSAGLVSITNPKGGILTENYYLQIGYEVGWLGLAIFIAILLIIFYQLLLMSRKSTASAVLLSAVVAYLFYSLLIHLWSNEAVALQWWLLSGSALGCLLPSTKKLKQNRSSYPQEKHSD